MMMRMTLNEKGKGRVHIIIDGKIFKLNRLYVSHRRVCGEKNIILPI